MFHKNLSIDKSMVPYRGLHSAKQYIKGKPVKFGYKLWMLCSSDGYPYNFEIYCGQRRSSRPPNPPIGGGPRPTLGAQVSLKLLFGYVTIFSSADLFTTDLNCRKKLACDIISECNVILSRRI